MEGAHGVPVDALIEADGFAVVLPYDGQLFVSRLPFEMSSDQLAHLPEA